MKRHALCRRTAIAALAVASVLLTAHFGAAVEPDFADFDRRAKAGARLNVVFFGASLTWGANATDPMRTSYRAVMAERFETTYPAARFKFHDAAIGGTGSQLGVFRLERDVLARRADLVFLDFSANDDINTDNPETLASYEAIVRRLVGAAHVPVVQVIFPFRWDVERGTTAGMKRRDAHLAIARAYNSAVGDAIALGQERVRKKETTLAALWPLDGVHPGDAGYRLFADAAWSGFRSAVAAKQVGRVPEKMLHADTYLTTARVRMTSLGVLPAGWKAGPPNVTAAYFDFQMSRWQDAQAIAARPKLADGATPAPLKLSFSGQSVLLFGETTKTSGKYRVLLDGKPVVQGEKGKEARAEFDAAAFARAIGGNGHLVKVVAEGLDPRREHTLVVEPLLAPGEELRLESVCVAGGAAKVEMKP